MTPDLDHNSDAKILQIFFATLFCKPTKLTLQEVLSPSVIPFRKPLVNPDLNPISDSKNLQIFLQPIFASKTSTLRTLSSEVQFVKFQSLPLSTESRNHHV